MFSSFENNSVRKKFRLSIGLALVFVLLLCGITVFNRVNNSGSKGPTISNNDDTVLPDDGNGDSNNATPTPDDGNGDENNTPGEVVVAEEKLVAPFSVDASIVRYYFDVDDAIEIQEKAVYYFNGVYKPNTGVDYSFNDEKFEVKAAFKGTVASIKNDALLGYCVYVNNGEGLSAVYASLSEVSVKEGDEVLQGDVIGRAGTNAIGSDLGNHLHFEILKNDVLINPTSFMNKKITEIN